MNTGEQMPSADGAPPDAADDAAELRREWSEATSLSESDRAMLGASAHLAGLRAIKAQGGSAQEDAEEVMLGMYEVSALLESELAPALLAALESTLGGIQRIKVDTLRYWGITIDTALRELVMKIVFKEYALDHIEDISDEDSRATLLRREIPTNLLENRRLERAVGQIYALTGNYRNYHELEEEEEDEDPGMSDVDPHIVLVIAGIEERALAVLERRYDSEWVPWGVRQMLERVKNVTRPKLKALIAEMKARIESIEP